MIDGKHILAIIPARGASKELPKKNLRDLCGKSLLGWSILQAQQSQFLDRIIVSTEDQAIIDEAKRYGCDVPFIRPQALAEDNTPGIAPVLHALSLLPNYDIVILLQPTSPLRSVDDIDQSLLTFFSNDCSSCVSVVEEKANPYWMYTLDEQQKMHAFVTSQNTYQRQRLPKLYRLNGAIYIAKVPWILQVKNFIGDDTLAYLMPQERSIDIDSQLDFTYAQISLQQKWKEFSC